MYLLRRGRTVLGQHTKTTVGGRNRERHGNPIRIAELMAQLDGRRFSLVEVLTMRPTDWFVSPDQGPAFLEKRLVPTFPLDVIKG